MRSGGCRNVDGQKVGRTIKTVYQMGKKEKKEMLWRIATITVMLTTTSDAVLTSCGNKTCGRGVANPCAGTGVWTVQ